MKYPAILVRGQRHRTGIQVPLAVTSTATVLAVFAAVSAFSGGAVTGTQDMATAAATTGNLVVNGKFEAGIAGWKTNGKKSVHLVWTNPGRHSHGAAKLTSSTGKKVVLNDKGHTADSAHKGSVVNAKAWLRARKAGLSGQLKLREVIGGHKVTVASTHFTLTTTKWTKVTLSYTVAKHGTALDISVVGKHVGKGQALTVDNVRLAVTAAATTPGSGKALLGMSAPLQFWNQRVSEVGPGLQARRLFFTGFTASISKAQDTCDAGLYPVMSFKTGSYTWADVAAGKADADLRSLSIKLQALTCAVFVAVHHEPEGDGTAADWSAMQVHALPILGVGADVKVGVIGNGWWWSGAAQGYTDQQIAAYITPAVIKVSDVIAGDTYQLTATDEGVAPKIQRMGAWARRVGGVKALGVGEFNAPSAAGITDATNALAADPLFAWGCLWNVDLKTVSVLTGARLTAFQTALANW